VKNAVWSVDHNLPLSHVQTLEHAIGNATWQSRFSLLLIGLFSALALVLAVIGIYGVMAYEVAQRSHEIGIRMALGAGRAQVLGLVLGRTMVHAGAGILAGIVAAAMLTRYLAMLLFALKPLDPVTFAAAAGLFAIVALAAAYLPARQATTVDPLVALRCE
jgi:putative ABC transport system permease protein